MKTHVHVTLCVAESFWEWEVFWKKFVQKIKTHFMFNNAPPPRKSCLLWDNVEKYDREVRDENIIPPRKDSICDMLAGWLMQEFIHTHIFNTYCNSTTKVPTRTLRSVTLNINSLYCCIYKLLTQNFHSQFPITCMKYSHCSSIKRISR